MLSPWIRNCLGGLSIVMDVQKANHPGNNLETIVYVHKASSEGIKAWRKEEEKQREN